LKSGLQDENQSAWQRFANAHDDAVKILEMASGRMQTVESIISSKPVVGNHAGPGTVGLAFITRM
jgi:hypothetical protein